MPPTSQLALGAGVGEKAAASPWSLLAIDPGPVESAFIARSAGRIAGMGKVPNTAILDLIDGSASARCVIEQIASYGMPVGAEVFATCVWIGRFVERWHASHGSEPALMPRREAKLHLCGSARAKDANIRAALIDLHGGKDAIGRKRTPGPLYGVKADIWQALALAVTFEAKGDGDERRAP